MMNYVLRMRVGHHRHLAALLRVAMPAESVTFLLCRRVQAQTAVIYLVDEIIGVERSDYVAQAKDIASVSPPCMAQVAQRARTANRVIVMAHLHPMTSEGVDFSQADHLGNRRSFAFFHRRAAQPEHLALVWTAGVDQCEGLVYRKTGDTVALTSVVVVDDDSWHEFVESRGRADDRFQRQAMFLGAAGQQRLGAISCAVIGLGGTGSLASLALVHHGVRHLVSGWASHIESMLMIRHRPHEGDRGDYESIVDSGAPSAARVQRGVQDFGVGAKSPTRGITCRGCTGSRNQPEHGASVDT